MISECHVITANIPRITENTAFFRISCPCVINPTEKSPEFEEIKRINHQYQVTANRFWINLSSIISFVFFLSWKEFFLYFLQAEVQYLISGNRYDGKEDFAVVLQPFLHKSFIPHIGVSSQGIDTCKWIMERIRINLV